MNWVSERTNERVNEWMVKVCITHLYNGYDEKSLKLNWMKHDGTKWMEESWNLRRNTMYCVIVCSKHCINSVRWHKCQHCKMITSAELSWLAVYWSTLYTLHNTHTQCEVHVMYDIMYSAHAANGWCIHIHILITWENEIIANNFTKLNHHNYRRTQCISFTTYWIRSSLTQSLPLSLSLSAHFFLASPVQCERELLVKFTAITAQKSGGKVEKKFKSFNTN